MSLNDSDSGNDSDTSRDSSSDTTLVKPDFIDNLLQNIQSKYENCDMDRKEMYQKLCKRIKFHLVSKEEVEADSVMSGLSSDAADYKETHKDLKISDSAAIDHAIKEHKSLLMEKMNDHLEDENSINYKSDDSEVNNEENTEENVEPMIGSGYRTKTNMYPYFN